MVVRDGRRRAEETEAANLSRGELTNESCEGLWVYDIYIYIYIYIYGYGSTLVWGWIAKPVLNSPPQRSKEMCGDLGV